jgi:hypothetical protein
VTTELTDVMLRLWWPAFAAANYTRAEMEGALPRVLTGPTPNWPREHLAAVNRAVGEVRADRDRRSRSQPAGLPGGSPCPTCEWHGCVVVPHPLDCQGGQWQPPYRTGGVYCTRCGPGRRAHEAACAKAHEGRIAQPPMTLDQYEQRVNAAWPEHMAERAAAERLMRRAEDATAGLAAPAAGRGRKEPPLLAGAVDAVTARAARGG